MHPNTNRLLTVIVVLGILAMTLGIFRRLVAAEATVGLILMTAAVAAVNETVVRSTTKTKKRKTKSHDDPSSGSTG